MTKDWTWIELGWLFGSVEAFLATALLMFASLVLSWRFPGKLLVAVVAGFLLAFVGHVFRFFILLRAEGLCGAASVSAMAEFIECTNNLAGLGIAVSAAGLLLAGVCLLVFAIRLPPKKAPHASDRQAAI